MSLLLLIVDWRNCAVTWKEALVLFKIVDQYLHNFSDKMYLTCSNIHNEEWESYCGDMHNNDEDGWITKEKIAINCDSCEASLISENTRKADKIVNSWFITRRTKKRINLAVYRRIVNEKRMRRDWMNKLERFNASKCKCTTI